MKILILRLSSMGDIILTQPVLAELKLRYPGAEIHYCCKEEYTALVGMMGADIRVRPYRKSLLWHLALPRERFDLLLDLHGKASTWLVRMLVPATKKVVYNKQRTQRTRIVKGLKNIAVESTVRLYYSALEKLFPGQYNSSRKVFQPQLTTPDFGEVALPVRDQVRKLIGIFVGAAHATKAYPIHQLRDFIKLAGNKYQIWLLGNASEGSSANILAREYPDVSNLCGSFDLAQLARVIGMCDLIISGDSGPMHLAAALGKPQIAIFGSTHPRLGFAPLNTKARILCADLDCQPCSLHGREKCPLGHFNCMREITADLLFATVQAMI